MIQRGGFVDTPYGPVPGCAECGVIALRGAHVCEHGVTPPPRILITFSLDITDESVYRRLIEP